MSKVMWHIALEPGTSKIQDVIIANLDANDFETIGMLLSTNHVDGKVFETKHGSYMLMYGGEYERPFPSVIIWGVEILEEECLITDMRREDAWIVEQIWREWLMPEKTDAEFVPPEQFIVMSSKN